ncbi:Protein of unknown function [Mesobacillus persicus]|uniref:DUF3021 domain-containing protein n=1 Tax=Mesobacillus persicus TaxID=930146 RepID=A0A1H7WPA2_9BACI|nr:DUF3021 family protein [Mesobacillus persicus]SEM23281.1 Protein of unknown function [Mesobacillus persicus]
MHLFFKGLIRGFIPLFFFLMISLWNKVQGLTETSNLFFFYGLIAFFLGVASVIYQVSKWSFKKQIFIHYIVMLITVFPTLLLSGFYPVTSVGDVLKVYLQFNQVGLILFLLTYFLSKSRRKYTNGNTRII